MKKEDFIFNEVKGGEYCNYCFDIVGDTKEELTQKYMEEKMISVTKASCNPQNGYCQIVKLFPFHIKGFSVNNDKELCDILRELTAEKYKELLGENK